MKLNRQEVRRIARNAFNELMKSVEAGKSETLKKYLKAMARFHRYSLGNAILISCQKPDATHVAGFRAWQKLGRHVRKGEHGIAIMAPIVYRREPASNSEVSGQDEYEIVTAFKSAYVFDISQTDGRPLPEFAHVQGDPDRFLSRLKQYVAEKGIRLEKSQCLTTAEGISTGGTILLKQNLAPAEEFSVLCHETAHEILHHGAEVRSEEKKVRETEAEAVAFVVCHGIGLDVNSSSCDYIQLYDGDKETLLQSLGRIQQTAAEILGAITGGSELNQEGVEEGPCISAAA